MFVLMENQNKGPVFFKTTLLANSALKELY